MNRVYGWRRGHGHRPFTSLVYPTKTDLSLLDLVDLVLTPSCKGNPFTPKTMVFRLKSLSSFLFKRVMTSVKRKHSEGDGGREKGINLLTKSFSIYPL